MFKLGFCGQIDRHLTKKIITLFHVSDEYVRLFKWVLSRHNNFKVKLEPHIVAAWVTQEYLKVLTLAVVILIYLLIWLRIQIRCLVDCMIIRVEHKVIFNEFTIRLWRYLMRILALPLKLLFWDQTGVAHPVAFAWYFGEVKWLGEAIIQLVDTLLLKILEIILKAIAAHVWQLKLHVVLGMRSSLLAATAQVLWLLLTQFNHLCRLKVLAISI